MAVHDLVEHAEPGTRVRVCRALASRSVVVKVDPGGRLGAVLTDLAGQLGTPLVARRSAPWKPALPTFLCPEGPVDYLVIGPTDDTHD